MTAVLQGWWLAFVALLTLSVPAGSLDLTFGEAGTVHATFHGEGASAFDVASPPTGGYIVAGLAAISGRSVFAMLRIDAGGTPDQGFGSNGTVTTAFEGADAGATAVVALADGRILAGGWAGSESNTDLAFARYLPDGRLDPTFGDAGLARVDLAGDSDALAGLRVLPGGTILAAATIVRDGRQAVVARLTQSGALDESFGDSGIATVKTPGDNDEAFELAVDAAGRILVTGRTTTATSDDILLARFTAAGEADPSFGDGGVVVTDVHGGSDTSFAVQVGGDGQIRVAGGAIVGDLDEVFVASYSDDGTLNTTFGGGGLALIDVTPGSDEAFTGIMEPDGSFVAAGGAVSEDGSERGFAIRVLGDGQLDASFGDDGRLVTGDAGGVEEIRGLVLDPGGRIVCVGRVVSPDAHSSFLVYRLTA